MVGGAMGLSEGGAGVMAERARAPVAGAVAVLASVLDALKDEGCVYCVQRNYEGYPEGLTGDVDLVVQDGEIVRVAGTVRSAAERLGWVSYQEHIWQRAGYLGLAGGCPPERFALTVELFAGAGWRGMVYLPATLILSERMTHSATWRPRPGHEAVITTMHHLLYNGAVPEKYWKSVNQLVASDLEGVAQALELGWGTSAGASITELLRESRWNVLAENAGRYKLLLAARSLRSPLALGRRVIDGYVARKRVPDGIILLVVEGSFPPKRSFSR